MVTLKMLRKESPANHSPRYDALTIDNKIRYQNGITDANKPFFDVSDGIFTNYWWREHNLRQTAQIAVALGRTQDVFSGVDVWGRGSLGDGGFNVGEVDILARLTREGAKAVQKGLRPDPAPWTCCSDICSWLDVRVLGPRKLLGKRKDVLGW